jgi:hypothetical protein
MTQNGKSYFFFEAGGSGEGNTSNWPLVALVAHVVFEVDVALVAEVGKTSPVAFPST